LPVIIDLSKKVDEISQHSPKNYSPENQGEWKQFFDKFDLKLKDIDEILRIVKDNFKTTKKHFELGKEHFNLSNEQFELLKQILEYVKPQPISKSQPQKFLPKNFPESLTYFTGREKVLENIAEALKIHGTAALAETHGAGKTSVMIEFAYLNQGFYSHILLSGRRIMNLMFLFPKLLKNWVLICLPMPRPNRDWQFCRNGWRKMRIGFF